MVIHVVKPGESLYGIARAYGVNYKRVAADNELAADAPLSPGQTIVADTGEGVKRGLIEVNGYAFANISDAVLEKTLPRLTYLSVYCCEATADGRLKSVDDARCLAACKRHGTLPVLVVSNLDGERGFSSEIARAIISDAGAQTAFIENALTRLKERGYAGIDLDFENIRPEDKDGFAAFLARLTDTVHNHGFFLACELCPPLKTPGRGSAHDYAAHTTADYVTVMCYERGGGPGGPGPLAPIPECAAGLDYALNYMEPGMVLMGIPTYGRDWCQNRDGAFESTALGCAMAPVLARQKGAAILYDKVAKAPYFEYRDGDGALHNVWFEDARSFRAKLNAPFNKNIGGVSFWTVNWYCPQCWLILSGMYDVVKG